MFQVNQIQTFFDFSVLLKYPNISTWAWPKLIFFLVLFFFSSSTELKLHCSPSSNLNHLDWSVSHTDNRRFLAFISHWLVLALLYHKISSTAQRVGQTMPHQLPNSRNIPAWPAEQMEQIPDGWLTFGTHHHWMALRQKASHRKKSKDQADTQNIQS